MDRKFNIGRWSVRSAMVRVVCPAHQNAKIVIVVSGDPLPVAVARSRSQPAATASLTWLSDLAG